MLEKKRVFVIGAGASKEFDMPAGEDLRNDIISLISRAAWQSSGSEASRFREVPINSAPDWQNLQTPGIELAAALPTFVSIDEALHYFSRNANIIRIGKLALAYLLLKHERESKISISRNTGKAQPRNCATTWLAELLSMAPSFAKRETVKHAFKNIHFINFNYDRIIEQYLCAALTDLAGINTPDAETIATNLNMIRPYGDLGPLDIPNRRGIPFGYNPHDRGGLEKIAGGIRTYTEQKDRHIRSTIEQLMIDSELVVFIGFGFHQQNVALLRSSGRHKPVFATACGIDKDNYDLFAKNLSFSEPTLDFSTKRGSILCEILGPPFQRRHPLRFLKGGPTAVLDA